MSLTNKYAPTIRLVAHAESTEEDLAAHLSDSEAEFAVESVTAEEDDSPVEAADGDADCLVLVHDPPAVDAGTVLTTADRENRPSTVVVLPDGEGSAPAMLDAGADAVVEGLDRPAILVHRVQQAMAAAGEDAGGRDTEDVIEALNDATQRLIEADSDAEVASTVSDASTEVLGFPGTGARVYNPEDETLEHLAFGGQVEDVDSRPPYDVHDSPHGRAFKRGEIVVDDIGDDDPYDREVFSQTMYVPIGEYGILSVGKEAGEFSAADERLAQILAGSAETAFERVRRRERRRRAIDRIHEVADQVVAASSDLARTAGDVQAASRDVVAAVDDIADRADDQRTELEGVLAEMNDLSASVEEIAASADEVANRAERTADLARTGGERAERATEEMRSLHDRTADIAEEVQALDGAVDRVSEVVGIISDIADQTNILALNASIEAAHAGQEGEGFAVVAQEVKDLASDTKESVEEIESIIDDVTDRTDTVVAETRAMETDVEDTVETVEGALGALEEIVDHVEDTTAGARQISDSTDQQASATEEVVSVVSEVADVSRETADQAGSVVETASDQADTVEAVTAISDDLEDNAAALREAVAITDAEDADARGD